MKYLVYKFDDLSVSIYKFIEMGVDDNNGYIVVSFLDSNNKSHLSRNNHYKIVDSLNEAKLIKKEADELINIIKTNQEKLSGLFNEKEFWFLSY